MSPHIPKYKSYGRANAYTRSHRNEKTPNIKENTGEKSPNTDKKSPTTFESQEYIGATASKIVNGIVHIVFNQPT